MKSHCHICHIYLIALAVLMGITGVAAAAEKGEVIEVNRGFYVVDGDSIHYKRRKLRLCGINAPEREHPHYYQSRQALINLTRAHRSLRLHFIERDKYEREVVVLFPVPEKSQQTSERLLSINEQMVRAGWAWHFKRYSQNCVPHLTPLQLEKSKRRAARQNIGLWTKN